MCVFLFYVVLNEQVRSYWLTKLGFNESEATSVTNSNVQRPANSSAHVYAMQSNSVANSKANVYAVQSNSAANSKSNIYANADATDAPTAALPEAEQEMTLYSDASEFPATNFNNNTVLNTQL